MALQQEGNTGLMAHLSGGEDFEDKGWKMLRTDDKPSSAVINVLYIYRNTYLGITNHVFLRKQQQQRVSLSPVRL